MKNFIKKSWAIWTFVLMSLIILTAAVIDSGPGYLENKTNKATIDTIGSATTNDTSYTFRNSGYNIIYAEFQQNSKLYNYRLDHPYLNEIRVRYLAADSTITFERPTKLGWVTVPIIIAGTSTASFEATLRTGNALLTFAGYKEE